MTGRGGYEQGWHSGYDWGRSEGRRDAARSIGHLLDRNPCPTTDDILRAVLDYSHTNNYCDHRGRN